MGPFHHPTPLYRADPAFHYRSFEVPRAGRYALSRHRYRDVTEQQKRQGLAVQILRKRAVDAPFERVVDDEVHGMQVGLLVTRNVGGALMSE